MSNDTTYKAFMAETSAKIAASLCGAYVNARNDLSVMLSMSRQDEIADVSINMAAELADRLDQWYEENGDAMTSMFDPGDTQTSRIEKDLDKIAEKIAHYVDER